LRRPPREIARDDSLDAFRRELVRGDGEIQRATVRERISAKVVKFFLFATCCCVRRRSG